MAALWLLMSGLYKTLILLFGVFSVILATWLANRMDRMDDELLAYPIGPFLTLRYWGYLIVEIAKANWAVTKIILSAKMPIKQRLFKVPSTQNTDMGRVVFANSITLTPGTITVEIEDDEFLVHALEYGPSELESLADMDRRVTEIETDNGGLGK